MINGYVIVHVYHLYPIERANHAYLQPHSRVQWNRTVPETRVLHNCTYGSMLPRVVRTEVRLNATVLGHPLNLQKFTVNGDRSINNRPIELVYPLE